VFAGAAGHTYGHNDVYDFFEPKHPGDTVLPPKGSGQRGNWRAALDASGATQLKFLRTLLQSRPMPGRVPDRSIVSSATGEATRHVGATRLANGASYFVYLPEGGTVTLNLERVGGGRARAWWYDPRNGKASSIGVLATAGRQAQVCDARQGTHARLGAGAR